MTLFKTRVAVDLTTFLAEEIRWAENEVSRGGVSFILMSSQPSLYVGFISDVILTSMFVYIFLHNRN